MYPNQCMGFANAIVRLSICGVVLPVFTFNVEVLNAQDLSNPFQPLQVEVADNESELVDVPLKQTYGASIDNISAITEGNNVDLVDEYPYEDAIFPDNELAQIRLIGRLVYEPQQFLWFEAEGTEYVEMAELMVNEPIRVGKERQKLCFGAMTYTEHCTIHDGQLVGKTLAERNLFGMSVEIGQ